MKEEHSLKPFWGFPCLDNHDFWNFDHSGISLSEDDKHVFVEANMPGLKADDIEIHLEKGTLSVRGVKKEEEKDKAKKYYRKATRSFSYSINLPSQVDESKDAEAAYKDGVLKVTFAKSANQKGKKITIKS